MATTQYGTSGPYGAQMPVLPANLPRPKSHPLAALRHGIERASWLAPLVLLVALAAPVVLTTYPLSVATLGMVYGMALLSLVVLTGYVGQISLCQASFMGLGAFLSAALMGHFAMSYWLAAPITIVVVFVVGILVGLPALRLRGLTLAIVTLSLALLADNFLFGGANWLTNNGNHWRIARPSILRFALDNQATLFRFILIVLIVLLMGIIRLRIGRTGKSWFAMRDAEIAAATSGVPVTTMKLLGFGIAAGIGGLAGVLYAITNGSVSPEPFTFVTSIQLLALVVIAGVRSLPGAILGALFYIALPQALLANQALVPLTSLILGAGLILQLLFAPQGIGGVFDSIGRRLFHGGTLDDDDTMALALGASALVAVTDSRAGPPGTTGAVNAHNGANEMNGRNRASAHSDSNSDARNHAKEGSHAAM